MCTCRMFYDLANFLFGYRRNQSNTFFTGGESIATVMKAFFLELNINLLTTRWRTFTQNNFCQSICLKTFAAIRVWVTRVRTAKRTGSHWLGFWDTRKAACGKIPWFSRSHFSHFFIASVAFYKSENKIMESNFQKQVLCVKVNIIGYTKLRWSDV